MISYNWSINQEIVALLKEKMSDAEQRLVL